MAKLKSTQVYGDLNVTGEAKVNGNEVFHEGNKPSKGDVGLGSVDNYSRAHYDGRYATAAQGTKADNAQPKESGKGLSTNDYTSTEKTKLSGIASGAQVNSVTSVAGKAGAVTLAKGDVGLGNVDNVKQAPITRTIAAGTGLTGGGNLTTDRTLDVSYGTAAGTAAQGNDSRLSNSREWTAGTIPQSEAESGTATTRRAFTAQRVRQAIVAWWNASVMKTKLDGIAAGATKNATDAQLRARSTHTGTQAVSTVSGLQTALDAKAASSHTHSWSQVTSKPSTFTPSSHTHDDRYYTEGQSNTRYAYKAGAIGQNFSAGDLTLDKGKNTTLTVKANDDGLALLTLYGDTQGTAAVEVGQSTTHGGGMMYNGDGTPTFVNGERADRITFYAKSDGTRNEVFSYAHTSTGAVDFKGTVRAPTFSGNLSGNADTTTKLKTPRTISLSGDVSGSTAFDGSGNVSITAAVSNDSHTHSFANLTSKPATATRWPTFTEVTGKPSSFTPSSHTHPSSQITGLGTAATKDVGTAEGDVIEVGVSGLLRTNLFLSPEDLDSVELNGISTKFTVVTKTGLPKHVGTVLNNAAGGQGKLGVFIGSASENTNPNISVMTNSKFGFKIATAWMSNNTTIDGSGFIKNASPIVKLYADKIEANDYKEIEECTFERVETGHYIIKGAPRLSRDGWYIETLKDRNNNIYFTLDYEELEDGLHIKTYEPDYSTGRATNGAPVDIIVGRFVTLRFEEDPSLYPAPEDEEQSPS